MSRYNRGRNSHKKLLITLASALLIGNLLLVTPAFASTSGSRGSRATTAAQACWPVWPLCWPPQPKPTSVATPTPVPGSTPNQPPHATPAPLLPPLFPSATPPISITPPASANPPIHLSDTTSFTMSATRIVATDAHLSLAPDPLHPVLTFASATIEGLRVTHLSLVLSASGTSHGTGIAIKTSVFREFVSALSSFTDKADLLVLLGGGTVHTLTMTNVSLQVDRYVNAQSLTLNGLHISQTPP